MKKSTKEYSLRELTFTTLNANEMRLVCGGGVEESEVTPEASNSLTITTEVDLVDDPELLD